MTTCPSEVIERQMTPAPHISVTQTSMLFAEGMTYDEWAEKGDELEFMATLSKMNLPWWMGDWGLAGEKFFPDRFSQMLTVAKYSHGTAANAMSVCRRFPPHLRVKELTHTHHAQVVSLPMDEAQHWLALAVEHGWTCRELRAHAKHGIPVNEAVPKKMLRRVEKRKARVESGHVQIDAELKDSLVMFESWWAGYQKKSGVPLVASKERTIAWDAWESSRAFLT